MCPPGKLKCIGVDYCINQTALCDAKPDCPDSSDEGPFCSRDDCSVQNGGCSHMCRRSPIGAVCFCPFGYATTNATNYKKCDDVNECEYENTCSQKCANFNGGFNCACEQGYSLQARTLCKANTRQFAKLIVTNGNSIAFVNLNATVVKSLRKADSMRLVSAVDFHNRTGRIYWADSMKKAIYSAFENGSDVRAIVTSGVDVVEAIAVDWIAENIYWTDYTMQHVEVAKLDGSRRKILFNVS